MAPLLAGFGCRAARTDGGREDGSRAAAVALAMEQQSWPGLSLLYVCPLKALLNNLQPRVATYAAWLGRTASVRHGDTTAGDRGRQTRERPSILLTTPESLEAMLVSTLVDAPRMFARRAGGRRRRGARVCRRRPRVAPARRARAARGSRRAAHPTNRPLRHGRQCARAADLASRAGRGPRPGSSSPRRSSRRRTPELVLDHVGNVGNAATVISKTAVGEKRLVFADSRRTVEDLAVRCGSARSRRYVSHSSLSLDERRRAEAAFAEARNCVIVSTSTLELGIDVGDLDRVVQIGAPITVASLLQRLGRTGRRPGTSRNMTFLSLDDAELVRAAGLLLLHGEGYVEPVTPPPLPRQVAAQQLLGVALQKRRVNLHEEERRVAQLGLASADEAREIGQWLVDTGHLDEDSGLHFVGPTAERRYGSRNFMDLLAIFTAAPEVTVLHGRTEIGSVDPTLLTTKVEGPRVIALAGKPWRVTYIDWQRRRAYVEPSDRPGRSRWSGDARAVLIRAVRRHPPGTARREPCRGATSANGRNSGSQPFASPSNRG